jgi:hypothetical protein
MSPTKVVNRCDEFICNFCNKTYKIKSSLQGHIRLKHRIFKDIQSKKGEALLTSSVLINELVNTVVDKSITEDIQVKETVELHRDDDIDELDEFEEVELREAHELASQELKENDDVCDECSSEQVHECVHPSTQVVEEILQNVTMTKTQKQAVEPSEVWLSKTNTDIAAELDKVAADNTLLLGLLNAETVEALYKEVECDECGETIDSWDDIDDHKYTVHNEVNDDPLHDRSKISDNETVYITDDVECGECLKYKLVDEFKELTIQKGEESIKKLGASLKKMTI